MNTQQAIQLIENGLEMANKAGVFKLQDSATLFAAIVQLKNDTAPKPVADIEEQN